MNIENENLSAHEIHALASIMQNQSTPRSPVHKNTIDQHLANAGFTNLASTIALTHLIKKEMVKLIQHDDPLENSGYCLTEKGENWLLANEDKLKLTTD